MNKTKQMNKKGSNFAIWIELVLFFMLIIIVLASIGSDMNSRYGKSNDLTLGLNMSVQYEALKQLKTDSVNDSLQGQTSLTDFGILKLLTAPKILVQTMSVLWSFIDGSFITQIVNAMNLGDIGMYIGIIFRILYVLALVFILLKLVLRINV